MCSILLTFKNQNSSSNHKLYITLHTSLQLINTNEHKIQTITNAVEHTCSELNPQPLPSLMASCTNSSHCLNPPESTSPRTPTISKASCKSLAEFMSSSHNSSSLENPTISFMFRSRSFITTSQLSRLPLSSSPPSDPLEVPSATAGGGEVDDEDDDFFTLKNCCSCWIKPV